MFSSAVVLRKIVWESNHNVINFAVMKKKRSKLTFPYFVIGIIVRWCNWQHVRFWS
jgi:hypothetical protein